MASHVVNCWTCVVMCVIFHFLSSDAASSPTTVDPKSASVTLLNVTNKVQQEKDVMPVSNTSEHTGNETLEATYPFGSMARKVDSGALLRGFYILVGIGAVVVVYVLVKMIRLRSGRSSTVRKYGVLASQEDLEMAPLEADDEEEDTTLFDASRRNQP